LFPWSSKFLGLAFLARHGRLPCGHAPRIREHFTVWRLLLKMTGSLDFENLVDLHYAGLYRFALSLTRDESDAGDLTQQTFYIWAAKGHQLQDRTKVKSWLYTTLHREFLGAQRRQHRFPHYELMEVSNELPHVDAALVNQLDSHALLACMARMDPIFRAPIALFYLEEYSYKDIARILDIPLGTVKSRIARGLGQLQQFISKSAPSARDSQNR
jgi:RNA polymerase sigma factor (sigma-70 family)